MSDISTDAKDVIAALDQKPHSPERAKHKFNMIRITERFGAMIAQDEAAARQEIVDACEWCER